MSQIVDLFFIDAFGINTLETMPLYIRTILYTFFIFAFIGCLFHIFDMIFGRSKL